MFRKLRALFIDDSPMKIIKDLQKKGYSANLSQFGATVRFDEDVFLVVDGVCLAEFTPDEIEIKSIQKDIYMLGFETPIAIAPRELGAKIIRDARKFSGLRIA